MFASNNSKLIVSSVAIFIGSILNCGIASAAGSSFRTVTFFENANSSDGVSATQTSNRSMALTLFENLSPKFSNQDKIFIGWNTKADNSGTPFDDGQTYSFTAGMTLYAIWASAFKTVTFSENVTTSDDITVEQTSNSPTALRLFSELNPEFVSPGKRFIHWNTKPDDSGKIFKDGAVFDFANDQVLFAIWANKEYLLTFDAAGGSVTPSTYHWQIGQLGVSLPMAKRKGFLQSGWYSQPVSGIFIGRPGDSFTPASSITVYAHWLWTPAQISAGYIFGYSNGSLVPTTQSTASLLRIVNLVKVHSYSKVSLFGFTQRTGSGSHSMQVSRARANNTVKVLRAMLKQHGVNDVVVTGKGVGVWPSRSSSRLQNRVEVFVG